MTIAEKMAAKFQAELDANDLTGICAVLDEDGEAYSANTVGCLYQITTLAARMIVEYAQTAKKNPAVALRDISTWVQLFGDIDVAEQEKAIERQTRKLDIFTEIVNEHHDRRAN